MKYQDGEGIYEDLLRYGVINYEFMKVDKPTYFILRR